jgi:hypothetical protein
MMGSEIRGPLWGGNEGSGVGDQGSDDRRLTTNPQSAVSPEQTHSGWSRPAPEHLSEPTYWPAVMALGIMMLLWGIVTSVIISVVGLALFALALTGWIGELLHENPEQ